MRVGCTFRVSSSSPEESGSGLLLLGWMGRLFTGSAVELAGGGLFTWKDIFQWPPGYPPPLTRASYDIPGGFFSVQVSPSGIFLTKPVEAGC